MPIIWSSFTNYKGGPTQWGRIIATRRPDIKL
jgi:hypothetical protein